MALTDIFQAKTSADLAASVAKLDDRIAGIDQDLAAVELEVNESQRTALATGDEPENLGALLSRAQALKDRRRTAQATKAELLETMKMILPVERRAKLKALQKEEAELLLEQQEAREGLLQAMARFLVLLEEVEGHPAKRLLAPHAGLDFLMQFKKRFHNELVQAVEKARRDRPEGVGARLKKNEREQRKLQEAVNDENLLAIVAEAQTA
jgi:hypothetical protein